MAASDMKLPDGVHKVFLMTVQLMTEMDWTRVCLSLSLEAPRTVALNALQMFILNLPSVSAWADMSKSGVVEFERIFMI